MRATPSIQHRTRHIQLERNIKENRGSYNILELVTTINDESSVLGGFYTSFIHTENSINSR
jgi:hypothetical protein